MTHIDQAVLLLHQGLPHTLRIQITDKDSEPIPDLGDVSVRLKVQSGENVSGVNWPITMDSEGEGWYSVLITAALPIEIGQRLRAVVSFEVNGMPIQRSFRVFVPDV